MGNGGIIERASALPECLKEFEQFLSEECNQNCEERQNECVCVTRKESIEMAEQRDNQF